MGDSFVRFFEDAFDPPNPPKPKVDTISSANSDAAKAAQSALDEERRRRITTLPRRSGTAAEALSAAIGRTTLGGGT